MKGMSEIALLAIGFSFACAQADTLTWKASTGGKWSDAANWSTDGTHTVPQSGDTIKINSLKSGETYENDIEGLSCPHIEFGGSADTPYPQITGKKIVLTGGWNAFSSASGRYTCAIPFELTVAADGNPTNRFAYTGGRMQQDGVLSGPGLLYVEKPTYYTPNVACSYSGGTYLTGGTIDPSTAGCFGSGDVTVSDSAQFRVYKSANLENTWRFINQANQSDVRHSIHFWTSTTVNNVLGERAAFELSQNQTLTVNGDVQVGKLILSMGEGNTTVYQTAVGRTRFVFNKPVVAASLNPSFDGRTDGRALNRFTVVLKAANNAITNIYLQSASLEAGVKNAFGAVAVIHPGVQLTDGDIVDLCGFDQTIDRIVLNDKYPIDAQHPVGHIVTSSKGSAALTLAATADCETDALFSGDLSLVWNPQGDSAFQTYAAFGREMPMTGKIVVSNGTFTVNGTNSFPHASAVEVADGATFVWASSCDGFGLAEVTRIALGDDATFEVAEGCTVPFAASSTMPSCEIDLLSTSHLVLREDVTLTAKAIRVDGRPLTDGIVYCGTPDVPGTTYLAALAGSVTKIRTQASPMRLSAKAYVSDGLVCLLDGIENAGYGIHDGAAKVWKDLTGIYGDFSVSNCASFTESALKKNKAGLMAWNTKRRSDVVTVETQVSGLEGLVSSTWVMPVWFNSQQHIIFKTVNSEALRYYAFDKQHLGLSTAERPNVVTIAATYQALAKARSFFIEAEVPEGDVYDAETWSDGTGYTTIGARWVSWLGNDTGGVGYSVNAVRFYTRELSTTEVTNNWAVDCVRFRGYLPVDTAELRKTSGGRAVACRLTASISGGTVTAPGFEKEPGTDDFWPELGQTVTLTVSPDAQHVFTGWVGDVDAIVDGTASDAKITVRIDRPLALNAQMHGAPFVVSSDTNLTENVSCSGITFLGPYTVTAANGVKLTLDEGGDGITVSDGVTGAATIGCPLVIGGIYGGERQMVTVPAGATFVLSGSLGGKTPLYFPGSGAVQLLGGGDHTGDWTFESCNIRLSGVISDRTGTISFAQPGVLTLDAADVGKLVAMNGQKSEVRLVCSDNTENFLRSGWKQTATGSSPQGSIQVGRGAELTIETTYNGTGSGGIYPTIKGPGTVHLRTDSDKISSLSLSDSIVAHVWKPMYQVTRSNYNRIHDGSKLYLQCENALTKSPWCFRGYVDLCGLNQTCGRFSYMSENSGSKWTMYKTGVVHSDEPATLTVYHDTNAAGGGNIGWQAFGGKFTGKVSLVKTGATTDQSMTTNDLVLAATSTSTGSVGVTWGLLSFANFTSNNIVCLGSWPNCTELSASKKGTLELCHSKAVGKKADLRVGTGGKVRLPAGVRQSIRNLYLPTGTDGAFEKQETCKTYGSSQSSAQVKLDAYFEGPGLINCRGENPGSVLVVR